MIIANLTQRTPSPTVTIAIPSLNQGRFLDAALKSIFEEGIAAEVYVLDGGSNDDTVAVLRRWEPLLAGWWSQPDQGQSWAINRGMSYGSAPYVTWLNADDFYLRGGLRKMIDALDASPSLPAVYGRCKLVDETGNDTGAYRTLPFYLRALANVCFICQPGTLIRRDAWEAVGGVDESLDMCMDYDLWWRLYQRSGPLEYVRHWVAASRVHAFTKTLSRRRDHYREAMRVVKRHWGRVPMKWYLAWPYKVTWTQMVNKRNQRRCTSTEGPCDSGKTT